MVILFVSFTAIDEYVAGAAADAGTLNAGTKLISNANITASAISLVHFAFNIIIFPFNADFVL